MAVITQAHEQWATRPEDERFTSLDKLVEFTSKQKKNSFEAIANPSTFEIVEAEGQLLLGGSGDSTGDPVALNAWSFGQLAYMAEAPVGYLNKLPAPIVRDALNHGLSQRDNDVGLLIRDGVDTSELAAVTGPKYGRIWNDDVARALRDKFGNGLDGDFTIPGEFGRKVPITKANTTLYAGDRDMFVFLADETNRIELPNRRNGETGSLARGFFVWNSEVGSRSLGIATFMFDYVCSNRIVWGAEGFEQIIINHTSSAPEKFLSELEPQLHEYAQREASSIRYAIEHARGHQLDEEGVDVFLRKLLTKKDVEAVKAVHFAEEDRPIESLWDASVGVTAYAKQIPNQDNRMWYERLGGKIIEMAQ